MKLLIVKSYRVGRVSDEIHPCLCLDASSAILFRINSTIRRGLPLTGVTSTFILRMVFPRNCLKANVIS